MNRRTFFSFAAGGSVAALAQEEKPRPITEASVPGDPAAPREQEGTVPATLPFDGTLTFSRRPSAIRVQTFPLARVRLLPSAFYDAQEANRALLHRYSSDRLLHTFRLNAGLPAAAEPLGGWERPDCEVRGHFTGHYLSACALMYASTGDTELRDKANGLVSELAKCQGKLGNGYLSAFPTEFFDRLKERKRVWAPFYTYHKILAGLIDTHRLCGNGEALEVAKGMGDWVDAWTAALAEEQMQMVLDEEFGGMNEALYNLAVLSQSDKYAQAGDRFTKRRFFNPLALRRDELRGLHTNTHIPQVIGAARRYEISSDKRFQDVAEAFWHEVVDARTYATGGTSNNEGWLTGPNHLAQELKQGTSTNECCCAYNMLKLTRQLYTWNANPRYFDYYERLLWNHRLGTVDTGNGHTQYYLGVVPGSWRTFGTEEQTFWCCTGTGIEEYSKLGDSIYFHAADSVYVNLFIPSELDWRERGVRLRQTNRFPEDPRTRIEVGTDVPQRFSLYLRIPSWVSGSPALSVNARSVDVSAGPGSYLVVTREWRNGDRVEVGFPMSLYAQPMPDEPNLQAFCYGPVLLAAAAGDAVTPDSLVIGPMGSDFKKHKPPSIPELHATSDDPGQWIRKAVGALDFTVEGSAGELTLIPFHRIGAGQPYSIYWQVARRNLAANAVIRGNGESSL